MRGRDVLTEKRAGEGAGTGVCGQGRQERMAMMMMMAMMAMMMMALKCMATLDTGNWTPRDIETWLIECSAREERQEREREK